MSPEQADALLYAVWQTNEVLEHVRFVGQVAALGVGILWGAVQWRLIILAKNQRSIW